MILTSFPIGECPMFERACETRSEYRYCHVPVSVRVCGCCASDVVRGEGHGVVSSVCGGVCAIVADALFEVSVYVCVCHGDAVGSVPE